MENVFEEGYIGDFDNEVATSKKQSHAAPKKDRHSGHTWIIVALILLGAIIGIFGYEKIFESKHIDDAIDEIRGNIYTVVGETQYYNDGIVKIGGLEISGAEELRGKVGSGVNVIVFYIDSDRTDSTPGNMFDWRLPDETD